MRRAVTTIVALCVLALSGCESQATHDSSSAIARPGIDRTQYAGRSSSGDIDRGKFVFDTNCATCHGVDGRSGGVGPSLVDEDERQDLPRTIVWIENPNPPMPKLYPSPLTEEDVEDVAAFVQSIK